MDGLKTTIAMDLGYLIGELKFAGAPTSNIPEEVLTLTKCLDFAYSHGNDRIGGFIDNEFDKYEKANKYSKYDEILKMLKSYHAVLEAQK
ncbi:hypothetical protein IV38_GL001941 [Lactobacillus selangorensis]|uniref:Uncharacterized protein n=1 Tax=Lactobacillus selangorensis TaxID=81857 RepID=A0A0R2FP14_9LACO|nr:hypothetical protein [Lactobacillus selangorensis]KRN27728.1 hypothetical protein IV38_GL001941 [Lactobacillus selangorensis]KRN30307.1 hypothetical protein IV40_GL001896 [Lactobacillus selangorensis]